MLAKHTNIKFKLVHSFGLQHVATNKLTDRLLWKNTFLGVGGLKWIFVVLAKNVFSDYDNTFSEYQRDIKYYFSNTYVDYYRITYMCWHGFYSECDCMASNSSGTVPCQCWTESSVNSRETLMSTTARFTSISAIAVSPDGVVNIADQVMPTYLQTVECVVNWSIWIVSLKN